LGNSEEDSYLRLKTFASLEYRLESSNNKKKQVGKYSEDGAADGVLTCHDVAPCVAVLLQGSGFRVQGSGFRV
jgi:hypothetical protein